MIPREYGIVFDGLAAPNMGDGFILVPRPGHKESIGDGLNDEDEFSDIDWTPVRVYLAPDVKLNDIKSNNGGIARLKHADGDWYFVRNNGLSSIVLNAYYAVDGWLVYDYGGVQYYNSRDEIDKLSFNDDFGY